MKTNCLKQVEKMWESFPEWPDSVPLDLQHKEPLAKYFCAYPSIVSELSLCGLFLFAERYDYRLSNLGDSLCVLGRSGGIHTEHAAEHEAEHEAEHAAEHAAEQQELGQKFLLIPFTLPTESLLIKILQEGYFVKILPLRLKNMLTKQQAFQPQRAFQQSQQAFQQSQQANQTQQQPQQAFQPPQQPSRLRIEEDRDDFDYLYRRIDLAELKGSKYHKKRNHVNYFVDQYQHHSETITKDNICDVFHVLNIWKEQHQSNIDYEATKKAILHFFELPLFGQITYVNGEPAAFVLAEYTHKNFVVTIHLEKANIEYRGLYQYINKQFAQSLPTECKTINREQDLGDLGLRKSKESYKPVHLVKKYRVYSQTQ